MQEHAAEGVTESLDPAELTDRQKQLRRKTHQTISKISDDIGRRYTFNTAIAASMELLNSISRFDDSSARGRAVVREALESVILLLSPIVPHICHELWNVLGHESTLVDESWPEVDESALRQDMIELVVQVNGKLRGRISIEPDADQDAIREHALADQNVRKFVADKVIQKTIVVPGRLVNIVV